VNKIGAMGGIGRSVRKNLRNVWGDLQADLYSRGALSVKDLALPDFLGIGAQKSGTTWLYENLRCHPDLFLPDKKELHYFDRRFHRSLRSYARHFEAGAGKVRGEITPSYAALAPSRIRYIRAIMPQARLIFLMRNPIDRAWSQALMNVLTRANRAFDDVGDEEFLAHLRHERSIIRGDYNRILERWLAVFPKEQLLVGFFEDVRERPKELLTEVFNHIGVSPDVDWTAFPCNQVVYSGVGIPLPDRFRAALEQIYDPEIELLVQQFGPRIAHWRRAER
jgi:hypothetical protein